MTVLKYHSASAGLRLIQPWLTFSRPSDGTAHGAECTNSPRLLIRLAGVERVALGTDFPFPLGETEPGRLIESLTELTGEQRARLLAGTAREFLGMA